MKYKIDKNESSYSRNRAPNSYFETRLQGIMVGILVKTMQLKYPVQDDQIPKSKMIEAKGYLSNFFKDEINFPQ